MSELLKKYYHIIDMYKKGEFGTDHLSLAEILEKAGEPDLIDRMNQSEIQHLIDNSTGLKKHMFIELKSKLKEKTDVNKEQKFDVLAVPCNRAFVVAKEKAEAFKNSKSNLEISNQMLEVKEKIRTGSTAILRNEEQKFESEKSKELIEGLKKAKTELLEINEQDPEKARELAEAALIRTGVIEPIEVIERGQQFVKNPNKK